jgi:hypothetical protein
MYLREPLYPFVVRAAAPIKVTALICTVAVVVFFIMPGYVLQANNTAPDERGVKPTAAIDRGTAVAAGAAATQPGR